MHRLHTGPSFAERYKTVTQKFSSRRLFLEENLATKYHSPQYCTGQKQFGDLALLLLLLAHSSISDHLQPAMRLRPLLCNVAWGYVFNCFHTLVICCGVKDYHTRIALGPYWKGSREKTHKGWRFQKCVCVCANGTQRSQTKNRQSDAQLVPKKIKWTVHC